MRNSFIHFAGRSRITVWWLCLYAALVPLTLLLIGLAQAMPLGGLQLSVVLLVLLPSILLAAADSRYLLVYVLTVWVCGPEVRRLMDWTIGAYQPVTIISLLPLLVTIPLIIPILRRQTPLSTMLRMPVRLLGFALLYGAGMGLMRNGLSSLYDTLNYFIPLLLLLYIASRPGTNEREMWIRALATLAVAISIYGWVQYLLAPPWDMFWMSSVQMETIGKPAALQFRMFATLNSPGPAATFLAAALAPMLFRAQWRGAFGWVGVGIVASALGITLVRSAWLSLIVFVLVYIWAAGSQHRWRRMTGIALVGSALYFVFPFLPGGSQITSRAGTLGNLQNDTSYNARYEFSTGILPKIISNPLGMGTGSTGVGTKLDNGGAMGEYGDFDNGFLGLLFTFGLPGGGLLVAAYITLGRSINASNNLQSDTSCYRALALATFSANLATLFAVNILPGIGSVLLWLFVGTNFTALHQGKIQPKVEGFSTATDGALPMANS